MKIISVVQKVMTISSFYLIFIKNIADNVAAMEDVCKEMRCGENRLPIRFPFRLKGQPSCCGCHGFELSCTGTNETTLELPSTGMKFNVRDIDYKSKRIQVSNLDKCGPHRKNLKFLNNSIYPFSYSSDYTIIGSTLFNCSYNKSNTRFGDLLPCLSDDRFSIYLTSSIYGISMNLRELVSCKKMYDVSSVLEDLYSEYWPEFSLTWPNILNCPNSCEVNGKRCMLKKNGTDEEPKCYKITGNLFIFY